MYTRCPHCQTTFRIAEAHLKAAKGMVRCGSCQEIFNATEHLSSGSPTEPPVKTSKPKPGPVPPPPAKPIANNAPIPPTTPSSTSSTFSFDDFDDPDAHEHIDLSIPVSRESMPDQSPFMESIYEENSPYNNLDEVGEIPIPGELNFGDSFIKFIEDNDGQKKTGTDPHKKDSAAVKAEAEHTANPYEDTEDKETPATTMERSGIDELYKSAAEQMNEDELLKKNIEELLSFSAGLDDDPPGNRNNDLTPNNQELEDFEKEIDNLDFNRQPTPTKKDKDVKPPGPVEKKSPTNKTVDDDFDFDYDFHIDDEDEELTVSGTEINEDVALAIPEPESKPEKPKRKKSEAAESIEDELPSAAFEIPKALRTNFENFEPPIRHIGLTMGMSALIIVLTIGFLFQLVFFRSYTLANQFPALTPMLSSICNALPCRYSGSIDVSQIELVNRDVRSHPTQKNALLISAAFINNAKFDQPYPTIAVRLADLSGHIVATRHFKPEEYLDKLYSKFLLMESGTPIHITLAVLDPGDDAINFEFSFL